METGTIIILIIIFGLCVAFGGGNVFKDNGGKGSGGSNTRNSNSNTPPGA